MVGRELRARALADPAELQQRLSRVEEPHVAPLNAYVRALRVRRGGEDSVPWFDPAGAGVKARILFLLEAPGARALGTEGLRVRPGSGFVSPDNNDATAANTLTLAGSAGLTRADYANWNVVPWYLGDERAIRAASETDVAEALPELRHVLALMPRLRVVVTMGRAAQMGWGMYLQRNRTSIVNVPCVHPSPRAINRYADAWDRALASVRTAAAVLTASAA